MPGPHYTPTPLPNPPSPVFCAHATRTHILCGGASRSLHLQAIDSLSATSLHGHSRQVLSVVSCPSDATLALSASADRTARAWDLPRAQSTARLPHPHRVHAAVFASPRIVATACLDAAVRLFDLRTAPLRPVQTLCDARDAVTAVLCFDAELVAAGADGFVRAYDIRKGLVAADRLGAPVGAVALSRDGLCLLAACLDGNVRMLERASGEVLCVYRGHANAEFAVACQVGFGDDVVVVGSEKGDVCVWDIVEGEKVVQRCHMGDRVVQAVAAFPHCDAFVAGDHAGRLVLWHRHDPA